MPRDPTHSPGGSLLVVGVGLQWAAHTTPAARRAIEGADRVLFAVTDPWAARFLQQLNPAAAPLPYAAAGQPRAPAYEAAVQRILAEVRLGQRVCAVFYGDPSFFTAPAHRAVRRAREEGFPAEILPGVSALSCLCADLGVDPGQGGCVIYEATDFIRRAPAIDPGASLILCQIGWIGQRGAYDPAAPDKVRAGLVRLRDALLGRYPAAHPATVYQAAIHPLAAPLIAATSIGALDTAEVPDCATLYVPPLTLPAAPAAADDDVTMEDR